MLYRLVWVVFVLLLFYDSGLAIQQFLEKQQSLAITHDSVLQDAHTETKPNLQYTLYSQKQLARETRLNQKNNIASDATTSQKIRWGSKVHMHVQKRDRYTLRRSAASRRLLHSKYSNTDTTTDTDTNTNMFHVEQVYEYGDNVMMQIHYSMSSNVIPIFMIPHPNIQEKSMLWGTFNAANNPCLLHSGVNTLCCINTLTETHKISRIYEELTQFICHGTVASTAATISVPQLYQNTGGDNIVDMIHTDFDGLLQDESFHSWADINEEDFTTSKHVVDLHMSREFISKHAINTSIRDGLDTGIDVYRFFVGVTFSELQSSNTIQNSATLSVISLLRNSSSGELLCSLVSTDSVSSISRVHMLLYSVSQYNNTYYFMRIEIETDARLGKVETVMDPSSVRWSLGLQGGGVSAELKSRIRGEWIHSCTFADELVFLAGVAGNFSSTNVCQTNALVTETMTTLSMIVPIGANLPLDMHVLYVKLSTDHTLVTNQMLLATAPRYAIIDQLPREALLLQERLFLEQSQLAVGLTDTGVVKQIPLELLPHQSADDATVVALGMAGSLVSNTDTALDNLISLSMPVEYKIQSLLLIHFVDSYTPSALTASEHLHQMLHLGELFHTDTADIDQDKLVDFCIKNTICVSQQVIVDEAFVENEEIETGFLPIVLYDSVSDSNITSTSEETVEWVRNKFTTDGSGVGNLIERTHHSDKELRLLLVDPSSSGIPCSSVVVLLTVSVEYGNELEDGMG
jgi:hypothetical protein